MGTVERVDGDTVVVRTAAGLLSCRRAVSCLVEPVARDFVLVASAPHGASFVLAVLTREGTGATLAMDGDVELRVDGGRLSMAAQRGVEVMTPGKLYLGAGELEMQTERARLAFDELAVIGTTLWSELGKLRLRAAAVDGFVDRMSQQIKRSFRRVSEIDQLDAKRIDHKAQETLSLRAESAVVTAEQVVKVDAKQILMG
jgi:hypothetical protein